ncbi:DUF6520 family protein [Cellulophaga sp. F20128]|uniref:DUF6520 family protein n=1 Tax=Cellulophaga sp. F20128 TaxID=2926413 RepID=UPI001FF11DC7|nr:DUF6520 family protein [Cellulophaga sp. F20128]MCK0156351.1 DUF6520 family protein [Cellulophaga sp. F20128]
MKTTFFKTVLPAFAMLLAISLSFATEASTISPPAYYDHPDLGVQPVPGGSDCVQDGNDACLFGTYPIYADESLEIPLGTRP